MNLAPPRAEPYIISVPPSAKDFIDDKLADALLYAGTYRKEVIRPSVQGGLCKVTRGTWHADRGTCAPGDYHDPTVIITHSLGGYMLMDSIQAELRADDCRPNSGGGPAEKILENTPVIYLMANQLALLDLSTLRRDPQAAKTKAAATEAVTKQFAKCWLIARGRVKSEARLSGAAATSKVVAFSERGGNGSACGLRCEGTLLARPPSRYKKDVHSVGHLRAPSGDRRGPRLEPTDATPPKEFPP
jgi:hypothetical protein